MCFDQAPRHVLMTADAIGGVWTYAMTLAEETARSGVRTTLAVMGPAPSESQRAEAARIRGLKLFVGPFKLEWMDNPWRDVVEAGVWLRRLVARDPPDVIHLNGYVHAAIEWCAPTLVVGHSCVLSWWAAVHGEETCHAYERYRAAVSRGLRNADMVAAPTRAMAAALHKHYGAPRRIAVVANGVPARRAAAFAKEPFVLAAGRLDDRAKNIEALATAARSARWPVYAAGTADEAPGAASRQSSLRRLGWLTRSELARWMARASIFAAPARYEPFGLGVLEAAAHGCALVLGDIPSLREVWGDAALYVAPDDARALAEAIDQLAADRAARTRRAAAASERARWFSAERMARRTMRLYAGLLATRGQERRIPHAVHVEGMA
jgi:glycosyltransferase involved in cell wall biosynthesis